LASRRARIDPWGNAVEAAARATAANRNSMLQDLDAGRPAEIVFRLVRARERRP